MSDENDLVKVFIAMASAHPEAGVKEQVALLLAENIDPETVECLIAFVPMAFAHVILGDIGVRLPHSFSIQDPDSGRSVQGKLRDEPIFTAAHMLARAMMSAGPKNRDTAREIASGSAEWNVIAQMTRNGSDPADCGLTEALLMRLPLSHITEPMVHETKPASKRGSWWKFWGGDTG